LGENGHNERHWHAFGATNVPKWCLNLSKHTVYLETMKRLGKIVVCLASGLVLNAGARADNSVLPNNPYAPIVVRNVFGLNPPQPVDPNATQAEPPPKITLNGITSILGQLQALFKVAVAAKAGQPAKDESYILSEGQRQDEIEVIQIDEKNCLVTFNNHGTVQELPLVKANAAAVSTPTPAQGGPVPPRNFTAPNGENGGRIPGRFGGRPGGGGFGAAQNRGTGNGRDNYNNGMGGGSPLTTAPTSAGYSGQSGQQPQGAALTPEEQAILLLAQQEQWKQQGNPAAVIIPPILTPRNNPGMPPIP
jgi:hypothetical protein